MRKPSRPAAIHGQGRHHARMGLASGGVPRRARSRRHRGLLDSSRGRHRHWPLLRRAAAVVAASIRRPCRLRGRGFETQTGGAACRPGRLRQKSAYFSPLFPDERQGLGISGGRRYERQNGVMVGWDFGRSSSCVKVLALSARGEGPRPPWSTPPSGPAHQPTYAPCVPHAS